MPAVPSIDPVLVAPLWEPASAPPSAPPSWALVSAPPSPVPRCRRRRHRHHRPHRTGPRHRQRGLRRTQTGLPMPGLFVGFLPAVPSMPVSARLPMPVVSSEGQCSCRSCHSSVKLLSSSGQPGRARPTNRYPRRDPATHARRRQTHGPVSQRSSGAGAAAYGIIVDTSGRGNRLSARTSAPPATVCGRMSRSTGAVPVAVAVVTPRGTQSGRPRCRR